MHDTAMIGVKDRELIIHTKRYRPRLSQDHLRRKTLLEGIDPGRSQPLSMVSVSVHTDFNAGDGMA